MANKLSRADLKIHAMNIVFRAQHGVFYPIDSKVLWAVLQSIKSSKDIVKLLEQGLVTVFKGKESAEANEYDE